jgi:hypothetical protein
MAKKPAPFGEDARRECVRYQKQSGRIIKLLTVQEILARGAWAEDVSPPLESKSPSPKTKGAEPKEATWVRRNGPSRQGSTSTARFVAKRCSPRRLSRRP